MLPLHLRNYGFLCSGQSMRADSWYPVGDIFLQHLLFYWQRGQGNLDPDVYSRCDPAAIHLKRGYSSMMLFSVSMEALMLPSAILHAVRTLSQQLLQMPHSLQRIRDVL